MSIEVLFNRPGKPLDIARLYREIRGARQRLTVASAWFTDTHIAEAIIEAPAPDKLVLLNAADLGRGDKRAVTMIKEAAANNHLRMAVLGSRDFTQGVMHHKFIAIDDTAVWMGSYNFTFNAQRNYENLIRIENYTTIAMFHKEAHECAADLWGDDENGMYRCSWCGEHFYPDEGAGVTETTGGFQCTKCRQSARIDPNACLMNISYEIPAPPSTPPRGRLPTPRPVTPQPVATIRAKQQVKIGGKK